MWLKGGKPYLVFGTPGADTQPQAQLIVTRLYRALLPFFLGVLLGDFLVPMGWAVLGLVTGQQMYLSYPH